MKMWIGRLVLVGLAGLSLAGMATAQPANGPPRQLSDAITLPRWASYSRPGLPLEGYFPEQAMRAKANGQALIHCRMSGQRRLAECSVRSETPRDMGFGQASLAIAPWLTIDLASGASSPATNGEIDLPVSFGAPKLLSNEEVTSPDWVERPTAADVIAAYRAFVEDQGSGDAAVRCRVSPEGLLAQCVVARQSDTPFGKAALSLTPNFRLRPLDAKGSPVAGREIVVPFQFTPD